MMFVFVITASSGYMIIFSSKHNITNCSIIYSDFGWPLLIMLGILWCLVIVSSISIWVNICKNFKEFGNTGLQKYHGNVERIQTSIMMKPCKEREAIIKSTIRMISYTLHYIVPCKLNYLIGSNFFLHWNVGDSLKHIASHRGFTCKWLFYSINPMAYMYRVKVAIWGRG